MKVILLALLTIISINSIAQIKNQDNLLQWLNRNAVSIKGNYPRKLTAYLDSNKVLGLGEASHGTKEFFTEKNKIIEYLVEKGDYRQIGFEFTDVEIARINEYVLGKNEDLRALMKDLRLYRTKEFYNLFEWIKSYNLKQTSQKVNVFGFHQIDFTDPLTRDSLMAENIIKRQKTVSQKMIIWGHNLHIGRYGADVLGATAMGKYLSNHYLGHYFNISFDTYEGDVNTLKINEEGNYSFEQHQLEMPIENFSALFSKCAKPNFFVYMRRDNPFSGIKNTISNIYADWRAPFVLPVKFDDYFDALIFVRRTSASEVLIYSNSIDN